MYSAQAITRRNIRALFTVTAFAALLNTCYQVPAYAMRLASIYCGWGLASLNYPTAPFKWLASCLALRIFSVSGETPALQASSTARSCSEFSNMAVLAHFLACILRWWAFPAQYILSSGYLFQMAVSDAVSNSAKMIALVIDKTFSRVFLYWEIMCTLVTVNMRHHVNIRKRESAVSFWRYVASPEPAWSEFRPCLWYGAVLVNLTPKNLIALCYSCHCKRLLCALGRPALQCFGPPHLSNKSAKLQMGFIGWILRQILSVSINRSLMNTQGAIA